MSIQSISQISQAGNNHQISPVQSGNPFLYAAFQSVAARAGAQAADGATYAVADWKGTPRGMTARVDVELTSFTGLERGNVMVNFTTKSRVFVPDAEPAATQKKASKDVTGAPTPANNPFVYAASQTIADLAGAQASAAARYQITGWRGDANGVTATVRVDVDSFTGSYHGYVNIDLKKDSAYFKPLAEPAQDVFAPV